MAIPRWQASILDQFGNTLPNASVEVRDEVTGNLVPLFSDRAGTVAIGNPFLADSNGFAAFYAANGTYQITATLGGQTRQWRYVEMVMQTTARLYATSTVDLFVRTDGSDTLNDGTADSSSKAFRTINKAAQVMTDRYDLSGQIGRINITTAGNFPENIALPAWMGHSGLSHQGPVIITGIAGNPEGVVVNPSSGHAVTAVQTKEWIFKNMKIAPVNGFAFYSDFHAWITIQENMTTQVRAGNNHYHAAGGIIEFWQTGAGLDPKIVPDLTFSPNNVGGETAFAAISTGKILFAGNFNFRIPNSINFNTAFVNLADGGLIQGTPLFDNPGNVTGRNLLIDSTSSMNISNFDPNTLWPGSIKWKGIPKAPNAYGIAVSIFLDFNTTGDIPIPIGIPSNFARYQLEKVVISKLNGTLTVAQAAVFSGAGGTGVTLAAAQVITISSTAENTTGNSFTMTLAAAAATTTFTTEPLFFRVTTPQGASRIGQVTFYYRIVT